MTHIENEARYEAAKQRNIQINAKKGNSKKFLLAAEDHPTLSDWLLGEGEFAHITWVEDENDDCGGYHTQRDVPMREGMFEGSFGDMLWSFKEQLENWGRLSEKQIDIVRKAFARKQQWLAEAEERKAARVEELKGSKHIGEIKQRLVLDLTVGKVLEFEGQWGFTYIHLCQDADGNQVVYKGSKRFAKGPLKVKATIKAHDMRDGVAQTLIARPTKV